VRILICNTFLYRRGGAETYTLALASLLRAHGHEVIFFAMNHPQNLPSEEQRYFADYIDFPTLHRSRTPANAWRVLSRSIYYPKAGRQIGDLIRELRPDIAHLQNIHAHLTPSIITAIRSAGVPIVWTLHDFKLLCPEHSFYAHGRLCEQCKGGRFYKCAINRCKKGSLAASMVASVEAYVHGALKLCRRVERLIAPSLFMQRKFTEFGWTEPPLQFVRNFLPELGKAHLGGRGYGLYAGMLRPIKGVATLLRGLALAGDPPFIIAGDGPMRPELEAAAAALGLRNTTFTGHLGSEALSDVVADASYAVVPSECYENCPYAILEAMAAGKPVIATNHGGMAELVEHERTGLLFGLQNAGELATMVRRLAGDPETVVRFGAAARRVAERDFTSAAHYAAIRALYQDVLASHPAHAVQGAAAS
jgi:glycosyltransferase involved in cell wall biosynthesis